MQSTRGPAARALPRALAAAALAFAAILPSAAPVAAADVTIEARALLGGHVRPGSWAAVSVRVQNSGPAVSGELRIGTSQQGRSRYGTAIELPTDADQEHLLYAQIPLFTRALQVSLVIGEQAIARAEVEVRTHDAYVPIVGVVAERPEGISGDIVEAGNDPAAGSDAVVVMLTPESLPSRPEAWSAIDRLVWQDVDPGRLAAEQLAALTAWVAAGGHLAIVGGTTGIGPIRAFPERLLPFRPERTVDTEPAELVPLVGSLPEDADTVPAIAGTLRHGGALAHSAGDVIAAQVRYGQGSVVMVGFDPSAQWLSGTAGAEVLWRRLIRVGGTSSPANPVFLAEDSVLMGALNNLPAADLPPVEQLFALLLAYIALIGPLNYLVLRRLDRREWAWLTMPALVAVFVVASYALGASLKGSDVIVNELAIVRGAQGASEGLANVYLGVFSPERRTFDVRIPGGALISNPIAQLQSEGASEQPIDVLFGDPSQLRNFEVGFGVLRGFRAQAVTGTPELDSDLRFVGGRVQGTVTNRSDTALDNVAVIFGNGLAALPRLAPDETRTLDFDVGSGGAGELNLSDRVFGSTFPTDPAESRRLYTRRVVLEQLAGAVAAGSGAATRGPVLVGWRSGPTLDVQLTGERPIRVGDALYVVALPLEMDSDSVVFPSALITQSVVATDAAQAFSEGTSLVLGRGTMTVDLRPLPFDGTLRPTMLNLAMSTSGPTIVRGEGDPLAPLPADEQPDQDDPLEHETPEPSPEPGKPIGFPAGQPALPALQLFDRRELMWIEFPQLRDGTGFLVTEPERWVDGAGSVLARFVNRGRGAAEFEEQTYFTVTVRIAGSIGR